MSLGRRAGERGCECKNTGRRVTSSVKDLRARARQKGANMLIFPVYLTYLVA